MPIKLSKFFEQTTNGNTNTLEICVGYNPREGTVECVNYIRTWSHGMSHVVDISDIMLLNFPDEADKMVDSIDWPEVYAKKKAA